MKLLILGLFFFSTSVFSGGEVSILIKMIPEQENFFKENILKNFEEKAKCKVNVQTFADNWELEKKLSSGEKYDVVKVPIGMARPLVVKKLVKPLDDIIGKDQMAVVERDYFLLKLGSFMAKLYYIPRKFETRIMVYRKSKVLEAVNGWQTMRPQIDAAAKKAFGKGLDQDYLLVDDPNQWNYMDLFVAGSFWASQEYKGIKSGRIAHRGKDYSGTAVGLMDRCFQMGARSQDILNANSNQLAEVLVWESAYICNKIYNAESWEAGWDGKDLWQAMGDEKVFLTFLTQIDCYFLYGFEGSKKYLEDPADLGFAIMPEALPAEGRGGRSVSTGGWLWGIGAKSDADKQAFELIRFITNYDNQIAECGRFGMIPVRQDILKTSHPGYDAAWKTTVFQVSVQQLRTNRDCYLPSLGEFEKLEKKYIDIWKKVIKASEAGPLPKQKVMFIQMGAQ